MGDKEWTEVRRKNSKQDDLQKISTSVFITNFPEKFTAKDLWNTCKQYGQVVDSFIPNRRSKLGKRFGFVRFIRIFDAERLVNNLCTIWVGNFKIHANIARFQRSPLNRPPPPMNSYKSQFPANPNSNSVPDVSLKKNGVNRYSNSYVHVVKTGHHDSQAEKESIPALVLDDSCGYQREFATVLMGKVKEISSLTNLKLVLANEGFDCITLKYMGGFWVMLEFLSEVTKEKFKENVAVGTWFSQLQQASNEFLIEERIAWIDIEGVPLKVWSKNTFNRIAAKWGDILHIDQEDESVSGAGDKEFRWSSDFEDENEGDSDTEDELGGEDLQVDNVGNPKDNITEEDSEVEEVAETRKEKDTKGKKGMNLNDSLKYPPGFTPMGDSEIHSNDGFEAAAANVEPIQNVLKHKSSPVQKKNVSPNNVNEGKEDSVCSGHFKKNGMPQSGGSILQLMAELIKVGQAMGYNMEGCLGQRAKKDWIKELCIKNKVNFVSLQETKIETIELSNVKECWGNFAFEYKCGASVGNSGGILCIWDPSMFRNTMSTASDYFIMRVSNLLWGIYPGNEAHIADSNAYTLTFMKKLKYLKEKIRLWVKDKRDSSSKNQKKDLIKELAEIDLIIDKGEGNAEVLIKRMDVINSLHDIKKSESMEMAQKAKIKWAIEGDENSKYFHGILNKRRNQLSIRGIFAEGIWIDSPKLVKNEFLTYFSNRFDQPSPSRLVLDSNFHCKLDNVQQADLENVEEAVFYFFQHGTFPKGGNSSFIVLIPKTTDAKLVKEFRPITLIGTLYKIIAKILANRFVIILGDLVNEVQSAFVNNRQILDGPFMLNEIFQWCKKKRKHSMIFKVDFEKAYDSVRWDYLDDVLKSFGFGEKWRDSNIDTIVRVLDCFFRALGLRINMSKSKIMGISVSMTYVGIRQASKIGCATLKIPFSYLGSKVGGLMSRIKSWEDIMNTFVLQKMEAIRCHFFNGVELGSKKHTWIKWNKVLTSKEKGGLGVSSLYALNRALMFKWVWRFRTQGSSLLWRRVYQGIHGENGKLDRNTNSEHPSIWLDIVREVKKLKCTGTDLLGFIQKKLGNGSATSFWEDVWRGDISFKYLYPRLFALETSKSITVASKLSQYNVCSSFRRDVRGGAEQGQLSHLIENIEGVSLSNVSDRWVWALDGKGEFSVASVRRLIDDSSLPVISSKTRWVNMVPIKINIHAWKVRLDGFPTRLNLSKRGMDIESLLCPLCEIAVESSSHIFFTCSVARELFSKITHWWDTNYLEISSHEEWTDWLSNLRLPFKNKKILEGVCYVLWWHIWNFRNKKVFGASTPSMTSIFEDIVSSSFHWCKHRCKAHFSFIDWLKNPHLITL
ncbi:RNA-directed DNA polymerase, eukaryota, reverse transcriptase zinc-binding domain protein [Tanacetum coccineum]